MVTLAYQMPYTESDDGRERLSGLLTSRSGLMGGSWVFRGTRVPVDTLFDNLADGLSLDEILQEFPSLDRSDCVAVLRHVASDLSKPGHAVRKVGS